MYVYAGIKVCKTCHKFVSILQWTLFTQFSRLKNIAKIIICTLVFLLPWILQCKLYDL